MSDTTCPFFQYLATGKDPQTIPVDDLFGSSNGTRRPGHNLSVEPGIIYKAKTVSVFAYVPVIMGREIKQDNPAKKAYEITGGNVTAPGASGNYYVFAGVLFKL